MANAITANSVRDSLIKLTVEVATVLRKNSLRFSYRESRRNPQQLCAFVGVTLAERTTISSTLNGDGLIYYVPLDPANAAGRPCTGARVSGTIDAVNLLIERDERNSRTQCISKSRRL